MKAVSINLYRKDYKYLENDLFVYLLRTKLNPPFTILSYKNCPAKLGVADHQWPG